jgi:transposase
LVSRFDLRRLVFVEESGTHISMDRLRSRAPRGLRAYGKVPKNRGKNLTLIASMSLQGMGESMCIEGATDAKAFEVYVEHFLAPTLREGQVVVMDNLGAHRPKRVRDLIEAKGAELVFVPSYSPELNPIEQAFSKIKNILRKLGARTHEALPLRPWMRHSPRSPPPTPQGGSVIAATRSRFSTYEYRCQNAVWAKFAERGFF